VNELLRQILFLPEQASAFAREVDQLHYFVIIVTMVSATAVGMTALLFFVIWRRRPDRLTTPWIEPRWYHEALFIGVPLAMFLWWFAIGFPQFVDYRTPRKDAMDVYVMGKKWMWKFSYAGGPNAIDTLHVPANRPVRLLITSRDVIHSFYLPAFRIKMDALPGRYTEMGFTADRPGRYPLFCAEYCGLKHSYMIGEIVVLPGPEFDAWIAEQRRGRPQAADSAQVATEGAPPGTSLVVQGARLVAEQGCLKCHTEDGAPHIGPTFRGLYGRPVKFQDGGGTVADEAYITQSMMDPAAHLVMGYQPVMPTFQGRLDGPETAAIVEFIKSLRADATREQPVEGPVYERK
jgi:cytochrome c oxidase subunit II